MSPRSGEASDAARAASRVRILEAARTLFAERGFSACRVADVARTAGMSSGNVYWHFESKEAILRAVLADWFADLESLAAEVADEYGPARRKLGILVEQTLAFHERNARVTVILGGLTGDAGRELVSSIGFDVPAIESRYRANLRRVFAEARSEGAVASADPDLLVSLYLALFNGLVIADRERWRALSPEALREAALRLVGYRAAG
jgi:AcrR family transcriptional regulator